jgi:ribosomal protein L20
MSRVKGGLMANKRRRNILEQVKGYRLQRSKKKRVAR